MFCTSCGTRMLDQDRFCAACGKPATVTAAEFQPPPRPLERDMYRKKIGGVCAGLANYLNWDVTTVRLFFVLSVILAGLPLMVYVIAWMLMPRNDLRRAIETPYTG